MKATVVIGPIVGVLLVAGVTLWVHHQVAAASYRLEHPDQPAEKPMLAQHAEAPYCTPEFKKVLQRVLHSCGLSGGGRRGCKPTDVKTLASISGDDFNALFEPLAKRAGIVLFDEGSSELDEGAKKLIEDRWSDRRGARYFFIVARGSKTGTVQKNRIISHKRANSVFFYISDLAKGQPIEKEVGMLWLGKEFAQLPKKFCEWNISRDKKKCNANAVNRSAFISWVDCRL